MAIYCPPAPCQVPSICLRFAPDVPSRPTKSSARRCKRTCAPKNSRCWPSAICAISDRMPTSNIDEPVRRHGATGEAWQARDRALPLAVTMGDPAGVGPDITLAGWQQRAALELPAFAVVGDADVLARRAQQLGMAVPIQAISELAEARALFHRALPLLAVGGADAGAQIVAAIERAVAAAIAGEALAVVTNPITKSALNFADLAYPGHTEYLAVLAARHRGGARPRP